MNIALEKTLIVSDSHVKCASFMNWLAASVGCELRRVHFSKFGAAAVKTAKYVDFSHGPVPQRCIAVEADALSEPLLIPLLGGAKKVVLFITQDRNATESSIERLSVTHQALLSATPEVSILFSNGGRDQATALEKKLKKIGITPVYPDLHTNDFRAIWEAIGGNGGQSTHEKTDAVTKTQIYEPSNSAVKAELKIPIARPPTRPAADAHGKKVTNAKPPDTAEKKPTVTKTPDALSRATSSTSTIQSGDLNMANINDSLASLMAIDGAMGCFIADYNSGMVLAKAGGGVNLDVAAAGNTEVIKAKIKTMAALGLRESIEDILITLGTQYHIIRPLATKQGLFLYIVLDKAKSNLAMARFKLLDAEKALIV